MQVLDVIAPGGYRRPRIRIDQLKDTVEVVKPKVAEHHDCCGQVADSVSKCCSHCGCGCNEQATDSVSASANGFVDFIGTGGGGSSTLIWTIVAVLFALALCFYLCRSTVTG